MKKCIVLIVALVSVLTLTGCQRNADALTSGTYVMAPQEAGDDRFVPVLSVDMAERQVVMNTDLLSSRIPSGTLEIADGFLTATIYDGAQFVFHIEDEKTISYVAEKSSDWMIVSEKFAMPAYDGALFHRTEASG